MELREQVLTYLDPVIDQVLESGVIQPDRVQQILGVTQQQLSEMTNLHRNTLSRSPASQVVQDRLGEVVRILATAKSLIGDLPRTAVWFKLQPLAGFRGQTAAELVADGHAKAVVTHLEMLVDGTYA